MDDAFDRNDVLDDADLFDWKSMTLAGIQNFLLEKGTLGSIKIKDLDGAEKTPAQIIERVAKTYQVSPRYLMALIQKEQSLVEDPHPTQKQFDWAAGFGVCDSCSMADSAIQAYKGFANQLESAAKQFREKYLQQIIGKGSTIGGYAPGHIMVVDGKIVIPQNQATAMLYTYTPHLHGNLNLWRIRQRWFGLQFPDGSVVRGKTSKTVYLIRFGEKRPYKSLAVALSMVDANKIIDVADSQLAAYPTGQSISFSNYALVQTPDKKRYLIVGQTKRFIVNRTVFYKLGFNEDEVVDADPNDLAVYEDGPDITLATAYPTGTLFKDVNGKYWYAENGVRHLITHKSLLTLYFKNQPARTITAKKLATLSLGAPYALHDGELIRSDKNSAVFVMENGKRRPIPSSAIFEELGWKWKNVITLPESLISSYPAGDPISPRLVFPMISAGTGTDTTNTNSIPTL